MNAPLHGFGLGLRTEHYGDFIDGSPDVDWLEVLTENYMVPGGRPLATLETLRRDWPMVLHGVSLSIGSTDPLDREYLRALKDLASRVEPAWVSDHLCWTAVDQHQMHDLLPMPLTRAALAHVAGRVEQVQELLGRQLVLENVSSYVRMRGDEMAEWTFLSELCRRTGCELLLDVNNVYVNSRNHGFEPREFIDALPVGTVRQIHLAGHEDHGDWVVDTHDQPVAEAVWDLYAHSVGRFGPVPTMIERDDRIPPLRELLEELDRARGLAHAWPAPRPCRQQVPA
jgi:uncharacterized protein (UPF0276 family)